MKVHLMHKIIQKKRIYIVNSYFHWYGSLDLLFINKVAALRLGGSLRNCILFFFSCSPPRHIAKNVCHLQKKPCKVLFAN